MAHVGHGPADHALHGPFALVEGAFERGDFGDPGAVGLDPGGDAGCELVERLDDELAGAFAVEGEDGGSSELAERGAEGAGGLDGEDEAVDAAASEGAGDRSVGGDHSGFGTEADGVDERGGVGLAASGRNDDFDASGFGFAEGAAVALADFQASGGDGDRR